MDLTNRGGGEAASGLTTKMDLSHYQMFSHAERGPALNYSEMDSSLAFL